MSEKLNMKKVANLSDRIMRFCQEDGQTEQTTAFACILAAASLGGEENKRDLMGFFAHVVDSVGSENQ